MRERFGPWSSALGDGFSPRLSTFWKKRLTMLAAARSARVGLTRRDWFKLGAVGAAACAVPTLHLAWGEGVEPVKAAGVGKIYIYADLKTGAGASEQGVFSVDPVSSDWVKLSNLDTMSVRVSRAGDKLAMARAGKIGNGREIENVGAWTIGVDGTGEKRRVSDFGGLTSWSSDGRQLVVSKWLGELPDDEMKCEAWRFNVDGSGGVKLPIPETDEVDDWSPDGRWFVTVSDRHPPHGRGYQLYVMRPDGTDQKRLTEGAGLNVYPRFSPDSRRVAYLHQSRGLNSLYVVNIDGSGRELVYQEVDDTSPDHLCWSPDGKSLAYTLRHFKRDKDGKKYIDRLEDAQQRLEIMNLETKTSRPVNLPPAKWISAPDWR